MKWASQGLAQSKCWVNEGYVAALGSLRTSCTHSAGCSPPAPPVSCASFSQLITLFASVLETKPSSPHTAYLDFKDNILRNVLPQMNNLPVAGRETGPEPKEMNCAALLSFFSLLWKALGSHSWGARQG